MNNKKRFIISWVLLAALVGPSFARADRLVLHTGKSMTGKITSEDDSEVRIVLGSGMALRVQKADIKEIIRTKKKAPTGPIVTYDSRKSTPAKKDAGAVAVSTAPAAVLRNPAPGPKHTPSEKNGVSISQTLLTKTFDVKAATFEEAKAQIESAAQKDAPFGAGDCEIVWTGKPAVESGQSKWTSLVVKSSATRTLPYWIATSPQTSKEAETWSAYLSTFEKSAAGPLRICADTVSAVATSLAALRGASAEELEKKTKTRYDELLSRADKKKKGLDRRKTNVKKSSTLPK